MPAHLQPHIIAAVNLKEKTRPSKSRWLARVSFEILPMNIIFHWNAWVINPWLEVSNVAGGNYLRVELVNQKLSRNLSNRLNQNGHASIYELRISQYTRFNSSFLSRQEKKMCTGFYDHIIHSVCIKQITFFKR